LYFALSYKRILVGVIGSPESVKAASHAIGLAKQYHAMLFAVTVFDIPDIHLLKSTSHKTSHNDLEELIQKIRDRLSIIKTKAEENGVKVQTEILNEGDRPEKTILNYAKQKDIDLIVIGKGKSGNLKELIVGSTALEIVKDSHCKVVLVGEDD